MHKILMTVGIITAAIGVLFAIVIMFQDQNQAALIAALSIGGGLIVSGALFWCFGAIVEHLAEIRSSVAEQTEMMRQSERRKAPVPSPSRSQTQTQSPSPQSDRKREPVDLGSLKPITRD